MAFLALVDMKILKVRADLDEAIALAARAEPSHQRDQLIEGLLQLRTEAEAVAMRVDVMIKDSVKR